MNDSSNSSSSSGDEVILNSSPKSQKKQISPSKRWCFTLNNYTEEDISSIVPIFDEICKVGIIGKEIGAESKIPHLQGYLEFIEKRRPKSLGLTNKIHWEKARGNKSQNVKYCEKEGKLLFSKGLPLPIKLISPDFEWEQKILTEIEQEPDDRTINWCYGEGNIGKTSFCKYLVVKKGAIVIGGKGADMRNAIVEYKKTNGETPGLS